MVREVRPLPAFLARLKSVQMPVQGRLQYHLLLGLEQGNWALLITLKSCNWSRLQALRWTTQSLYHY